MNTATTVPNTRSDTGWGPLAVLMCGTFLVVLDFFIVNVALPSMQRDLHASSSGLEWVVAGYGLTFSALLIAVTRLGDRWGRRRMFSSGVALFVAASAACGAAPSTELLVGARLAQGVAGAMVSPMVLALIGDVYAGPRLPRAIGIYSTVMGLAAATGQLIGGLLIHLDLAGSGWRAIFWVNVPVGVAALVLAPRLLPDRRVPGNTRIDLVELGLATATLTALLLPLLEGRRLGWPLWTWMSLAGAVLAGVLTVVRSRALLRRGRRPLVEPAAFGSRSVRVAIACQGLLFVGMASYFLVLALYLQDGRGLGALASGAVFAVVAVPYMVGTSRQRRLAARLGRWTVPLGASVFALGHVALLVAVSAHGVSGPLVDLVPGLALAGFGMGIALTGLIDTAMGNVEPVHAGAVSGVLSTAQQLGNALGVALVGMVFFGAVSGGYAHALEWSLVALVGSTAGVALLALLLQPRRTTPAPSDDPATEETEAAAPAAA
ncbi:MAG: MFS transporter [Nocardioides sp.]|nr:MFS transporter [Nocardioides sp.]